MKRRRQPAHRSASSAETDESAERSPLEIPPIESLLTERALAAGEPTGAAGELGTHGPRIGVLTVGRGQLARQLAEHWPKSSIECLVLDSFQAALIEAAGTLSANLQVACAADWTQPSYDLIVAPLRRRESAELNRDLLQSAFAKLRIGGELLVGVDSQSHPALLDELREWTRPVACQVDPRGLVVHLTKKEELKRVRDFRAEVVFRDGSRLLRLVTRPGVFAHRQLDPGARQILKAVHARSGQRILDLGCGSGAIAVALAARDETLEVWAVDSHARAVEATRAAAELNHLDNVQVVLSHLAEVPGPGSFDLVTGNPPYFANFEIARRFLDGAVQALRPGGECLLVTKLPQWYREHASQWLSELEIWPSGHYHLIRGQR